MTKEHRQVLNLIGYGVDSAITKKHIGRQAGLSARKVEQLIRDLIVENGIEIASSCEKPFGYFLIKDEIESKRYHNQLISRIRKLNERLSAVDRNTARRISQTLQRELSLHEFLNQ